MKLHQYNHLFDLGSRNGEREAEELTYNAIWANVRAMKTIMERESMNEDHPGAMTADDLSLMEGRLSAYEAYLDMNWAKSL
jgi:hypothetical protein